MVQSSIILNSQNQKFNWIIKLILIVMVTEKLHQTALTKIDLKIKWCD